MQLSDASVYNADRRDKAPRVSESCLSSFFLRQLAAQKQHYKKEKHTRAQKNNKKNNKIKIRIHQQSETKRPA